MSHIFALPITQCIQATKYFASAVKDNLLMDTDTTKGTHESTHSHREEIGVWGILWYDSFGVEWLGKTRSSRMVNRRNHERVQAYGAYCTLLCTFVTLYIQAIKYFASVLRDTQRYFKEHTLRERRSRGASGCTRNI